MYREHLKTGGTLSGEQLNALSRMKQFTDFNDLANKSALGQEGVDRQVRSLVDQVVEKHGLGQAEQQQQDRNLDQTQAAMQATKSKRRRAVKVA
jgi:putative DNA primase/helicase